MSQSPGKAQEEDAVNQSPVEEGAEQDGSGDGVPMEGVDVKEQDRWLPIANGSCYFLLVVGAFACDLCTHCAYLALPSRPRMSGSRGTWTRMAST